VNKAAASGIREVIGSIHTEIFSLSRARAMLITELEIHHLYSFIIKHLV